MTWSARLAAARAFSLGQPSRGLTRRSSDRPKLAMARATMPMFSPSCGSTRMIAGPADWRMLVGVLVSGMIVNEPLFAAFQASSLPYSAAKMKHSQMIAGYYASICRDRIARLRGQTAL